MQVSAQHCCAFAFDLLSFPTHCPFFFSPLRSSAGRASVLTQCAISLKMPPLAKTCRQAHLEAVSVLIYEENVSKFRICTDCRIVERY